jgi:hypothetical protein
LVDSTFPIPALIRRWLARNSSAQFWQGDIRFHGTISNSKPPSESGTLFDEETMPGAGRHRFEFEGKEPLVLWVVVTLLFANTALMFMPDFVDRYFSKLAPEVFSWYSHRSIAIQFILLALLAAIFIIFRKRVRYIRGK